MLVVKNKNILKWRIQLGICYIKTGILYILFQLWLFSPGFLVLLLPEGLSILGWLCLVGVYFNFKIASGENFIAHKWFNQLESEREELRFAIAEEKSPTIEVGNTKIKILPFGKK